MTYLKTCVTVSCESPDCLQHVILVQIVDVVVWRRSVVVWITKVVFVATGGIN